MGFEECDTDGVLALTLTLTLATIGERLERG